MSLTPMLRQGQLIAQLRDVRRGALDRLQVRCHFFHFLRLDRQVVVATFTAADIDACQHH